MKTIFSHGFLPEMKNAQRGRFPVTWRNFYKIKFQREEDGSVGSLIWEHDGAWSDGERFYRDGVTAEEKH